MRLFPHIGAQDYGEMNCQQSMNVIFVTSEARCDEASEVAANCS